MLFRSFYFTMIVEFFFLNANLQNVNNMHTVVRFINDFLMHRLSLQLVIIITKGSKRKKGNVII